MHRARARVVYLRTDVSTRPELGTAAGRAARADHRGKHLPRRDTAPRALLQSSAALASRFRFRFCSAVSSYPAGYFFLRRSRLRALRAAALSRFSAASSSLTGSGSPSRFAVACAAALRAYLREREGEGAQLPPRERARAARRAPRQLGELIGALAHARRADAERRVEAVERARADRRGERVLVLLDDPVAERPQLHALLALLRPAEVERA